MRKTSKVLSSTTRTVTERLALQESEAKIHSILDTVVDGVITIDGSGIIRSFNPAAERLFGYKAEEVVGQNVKVLMPEPYHSEHDSYLSNYLRTGKAKIIGIGREVVARRKDGTTFPIDLAVGEIKTDDSRHMFTGIVRDITERKRLEQVREQFLSHVTHQLRTPLGPLKVHVEYALAGKLGPLTEKLKSSLQVMKMDTDRLVELTDQLLDISRFQSGKFRLNLQPLDLREIINQSVKEAQVAIDVKKQDLHVELPDRLLRIIGDPTRLSQVMTNLLNNASMFTPETGRITLMLDDKTEDFKVAVSDTGIGIRKEDLAEVFLPFAAIQKPTWMRGAGLGLSISKGIVEAHGGKIWVESDGEGKGATFTFTLPKLARVLQTQTR
jgi:PAS domain S-box-containing protein